VSSSLKKETVSHNHGRPRPFIFLHDGAEDVATVKRKVALQVGPVLLVGHSYGGVVITEAGDDPKVAGLVYGAAFAPDLG
jgi:pimeloyl-ACP methyl ester carboxylesterase